MSRSIELGKHLSRPSLVVVPLCLVVLLYLGATFASASSTARGTSVDGTFPRTFVGMPLFEGFAEGDRFGVHLQWGALVLLVPVLAAILLTIVAFVRSARERT